ncbi:MAG: hypothetical protein IJ716_09535 [Lachnospiraceae bacterium]|nr:hypothetical protein [Lachnospiraceae bacterium]
MGAEWINIKETGQLYLEKILVSFDIPILFVCTNFEKKRFLCLNIDEESGKTVIAEINNNLLLFMLRNEITMESVFRKAEKGVVIIADYNGETEKIDTCLVNANEISADFLPKKGAYFEFSNKTITDYIAHLRKELIDVVLEQLFEAKSYTIQSNGIFNSFGVDTVGSFECGKLSAKETGKKCLYNVSDSDKMIA